LGGGGSIPQYHCYLLLLTPKKRKGRKEKEKKIKRIKTREHKAIFLCPNQGHSLCVCVCVFKKKKTLLVFFMKPPNSRDYAMFGLNSQRSYTQKTSTKISKSPSKLP
jgi:hypothetical protein